MKMRHLIIPLSILVVSISCKKNTTTDPPPPPPPSAPTGSLKLSFEDRVDTLPLIFGNNYVNAHGDTFQVSKFNYYISNIVLIKNDNSTVYAEPYSYHLLKHSVPASQTITVTGIPTGSYLGLRFVLGVDSARNASNAQPSGDLDPVTASDMYWGWGSGYVTLKLEGTSPVSGAPDKSLTFHMGGYSGVNKSQRLFSVYFGGGTANISTTGTPTVNLNVNVNRLFSPDTIKFATQYTQAAPGPGVKIYADNYARMISFRQLTN